MSDFSVRDPIHNFIRLPAVVGPVVNCGPLQRLRGIRQLALASLVYPGALHTRFDHTLGVTHVAGEMAKRLGAEPDEVGLVQLAGLLHDAGHGPFSHVSEASLDRFGDRSKLKPNQAEHKIHEAVTAEIIRTDPELCRIIPEEMRERVIRLLGKWDGRPFLKQVVSGPLDADKQDYLLRDSHFCGVQYGRYDLAQLHRSLVLPDRDADLMIDDDGVHACEQFVLAKYYMTANVYRHRVRLITDQMITRAIRLGIEVDKLEQMGRLYRFDGSAGFVKNYQQWDDARFMEKFCPLAGAPPGAKSGEMLRRLRERSLLKEVFKDTIGKPYDARIWETLKGLPKRNADAVAPAVERAVAGYLTKELKLATAIDPDFVIAYSYSIKSARESSRNDEEGILVHLRPSPQFFVDESTLFKSINEAFSDNHIVLFAPIEWPDPVKKDDLRTSWKDAIRGIIEAECKKVKP
ncbi:MAG TPA: HD domain-containing protein [Gemmataceae bacterium]|nr:HD domain-containing protein [Gemmataceae bacterium]